MTIAMIFKVNFIGIVLMPLTFFHFTSIAKDINSFIKEELSLISINSCFLCFTMFKGSLVLANLLIIGIKV